MDSLKGNVIEGIGDLLTKLPLDSIVEKDKIGEVDIQTRYYEPLLSAILADTTKKVILRWPNKMDETAPEIRLDAIISTLVQLKFGRHLGYGEVKPGDNSTTTQSLCVDTLKLTVLSRNTCLKNEHPILAFQINGSSTDFLCDTENSPPFLHYDRDWPRQSTRFFIINPIFCYSEKPPNIVTRYPDILALLPFRAIPK